MVIGIQDHGGQLYNVIYVGPLTDSQVPMLLSISWKIIAYVLQYRKVIQTIKLLLVIEKYIFHIITKCTVVIIYGKKAKVGEY